MHHTRLVALALALIVPAQMATAQATPCADQLVRGVETRLPRIAEGLDVRDLTCAGIVQIHFLLTHDNSDTGLPEIGLRQRIESVFRREGLLR